MSPVFVSKSCPRLYFFGNFSSNLAISLVVYFAAFPSFYDVQQLKVFTHPTFHKIRLIKFQRSVSKVLLSQRESTVDSFGVVSSFCVSSSSPPRCDCCASDLYGRDNFLFTNFLVRSTPGGAPPSLSSSSSTSSSCIMQCSLCLILVSTLLP